MNIFCDGPKNQNSTGTFRLSAYGFHNFLLSFCKENQNKVSACFYEIT